MSEVGFVDIEERLPPRAGHYIVLQVRGYFPNQWVRYWDGKKFDDPREDKYGQITHWSPLLPFPDCIPKKKAHVTH